MSDLQTAINELWMKERLKSKGLGGEPLLVFLLLCAPA
jgi:hypothetical protein